ncbi:MAG: hypothetical protein NTX15_01545 [Candidatus Kapabacteria bacterium]|nr:hypothetical protein [Candidatus Kapabacteria bacterium]
MVEYLGHSDVAIDWVQVGTDNFTRLTRGEHDQEILTAYNEINDRMTAYNAARFGTAISPERIRIWRWYNRDEGPEAWWEGMRYQHALFDHNTITEFGWVGLNPSMRQRFQHCTEMGDLWEGATPVFTPNVITPFYRRGYGGTGDGMNTWGVMHGSNDMVWPNSSVATRDSMNYDLHWGTQVTYDASAAGLAKGTSLPVVIPPGATGPYPRGTEESHGLQGRYEQLRMRLSTEGDYLFDDNHRWIANIWLGPDMVAIHPDNTNTPSNVVVVVFHSRFLTGEEASLLSWSQVILGTKGLIDWYGPSPDLSSGQGNYSQEAAVSFGVGYGAASEFLNQYVWNANRWQQTVIRDANNIQIGPLRAGATTVPQSIGLADALTLGWANQPARNPLAGPDWLAIGDPTGLFDALATNSVPPATALGNLYQGFPTGQFYVGWLSTRSAFQSVHEVLSRAAGDLGHLHLRGWFSRGFNTWTRDATGIMAQTINLGAVRSRHPNRDVAAAIPTWEDNDSSFVELTMLEYDNHPVNESFVIGVLNRRANPFDYMPASSPVIGYNHIDRSTFRTYEEHRLRVVADASPTKDTRYRQEGARQIEIPFTYHDADGQYRFLRVRDLGVETNAAEGVYALDTIIGQDKTLALNFLPGQGKMLRVDVLAPGTEQITNGFLDHSNQRKLVAYPEITAAANVTDPEDGRTYLRETVGDRTWFHQVYHRRRFADPSIEDINNIPLSVYYRRSDPVRTSNVPGALDQNAFDATTLTWQPEILVSDQIMLDPDAEGPLPRTQMDLSCGYPSLVVRTTPIGNIWVSRVYIVFACEYDRLNTRQVLVCESVFNAEAPNAVQVAQYGILKSEVIAQTTAPLPYYLDHWGTPMINASRSGNFYCWSTPNLGIGIGFKQPNMRLFNPQQTAFVRGRVGAGMVSAHPSLNSYSRLHIGEEDATLVWQEGQNPVAGPFVFYTRLFHGPAPNYILLPNALNPGPVATRTYTGAAFVDPLNPGIGLITDGFVNVDDVDFPAQHAYPVVFRHLSDWETAPASVFHQMRLVNHKAERIYWQTQKTHLGLGPWMIGRRNIDVSDLSVSPLGMPDNLWSQPEEFVFSAVSNLRGPDVSQGAQWGEAGSVPNNPNNTASDSCSVLNFWLEANENSAFPKPWHMMFGWSFYGQMMDHNLTNLVASGIAKELHVIGRYPHLAARYSVSAHPGIQRDRRIFNGPGPIGINQRIAPSIAASAEQFFKPEKDVDAARALTYNGFRGAGNSACVGTITIGERETEVVFHPTITEEMQGAIDPPLPREYVSEWTRLGDVEDVSFTTQVLGKEQAATVFIEREKDKIRAALGVLDTKRAKTQKKETLTFIGAGNNRYRFVIYPMGEDVHAVTDIEIVNAAQSKMAKSVEPDGSEMTRRSFVDLRNMSSGITSAQAITIFPNPATNAVSVIVAGPENSNAEGVDNDGVHAQPVTGIRETTSEAFTIVR